MSTQTVAQCAANVRALSNSVRSLQNLILDTEPKVGRIDEYARTEFRALWISNRKEYDQLVNASQAAATKLAASIEYYLSFQGDINDPQATDDLIKELGAFKVKLEGLNFDQSSDFDALKIGFQQLGRNLAAAVQEHGSAVQSEFEAAQAEVSALDKQLQEINAKIKKEHETQAGEATSGATTLLGGLLGGGKDKKAQTGENTATPEDEQLAKEKKAAELANAKQGAGAALGKLLGGGGEDQYKAERYAIQEKLSIAQARLVRTKSTARDRKAADSEGVLSAIEDIQKSLDTQIELLKTFPNLAKQLTNEVTSYLTAFENIKCDPSVDNQRQLANLNRKVELAAGSWKEVADLLAEGYAKSH